MMNIVVSGLGAMQRELDSIAHNVSNTETVGYKKMSNVFSDVYVNAYQDRAPSLPGFSGVARQRVMQAFTGGALKSTGSITDMAIVGKGFFVLERPNSTQKLSRNGIFHVDKEYTLVDSEDNKVQGFKVDVSGQLVSNSLSEIKLQPDLLRRVGESTTEIDATLNLDGASDVITGWGHRPIKWNLMNETVMNKLPKVSTYSWMGAKMEKTSPIINQVLTFNVDGTDVDVNLKGGESAAALKQSIEAQLLVSGGVSINPQENRVKVSANLKPGTTAATKHKLEMTVNGHSSSILFTMDQNLAALKLALDNLPPSVTAENISLDKKINKVEFDLVNKTWEDIEINLDNDLDSDFDVAQLQAFDDKGTGYAKIIFTKKGDQAVAIPACDLEAPDSIKSLTMKTDATTGGLGSTTASSNILGGLASPFAAAGAAPYGFKLEPTVAQQEITLIMDGKPEVIKVPASSSAAEIAKLFPPEFNVKPAPTRVELSFEAMISDPAYELKLQIDNGSIFSIKANQIGPQKNIAALFTQYLPPHIRAIDGGDGGTVVLEAYEGENIVIKHVGITPLTVDVPPKDIFKLEVSPIMSDGKPSVSKGDLLAIPDLEVMVTSYLEAEVHHSVNSIEYISNVALDKGGITSDVSQNITLPASGLAFDPTNPKSFNWSTSFNVYDNIGTERGLTAYFIQHSEGEWNIEYQLDGDPNKIKILPLSMREHKLYFNSAGELDTTIPENTGLLKVEIDPGNNIAKTEIDLDFSDISQYADDYAIYASTRDGRAPGQFQFMDIANGGLVQAIYSNGEKILAAKIALAVVPNEQDMLSVGNGWEETMQSGEPIISSASVGNAGNIKTNFLEASNVDLLEELVKLVVAQQNYQANTKTLKTSETVTQSLLSIF